MKSLKVLVTFFVLFSILPSMSFSQNDKTGRSHYTLEEVKAMCGVPVDTIEMKKVLAIQDSMYKDYLSKKGLKKITTIPNWQSLMGNVDNQYGCRNCWAHAAAGMVEGQLQILHGSIIGERVNLDEMDIVNNSGHSGGCDKGDFPHTALSYVQNSKTISETGSYPNLQGVRWDINSYNVLGIMGGIIGIQNALVNGPVTACFYVYDDFEEFFWDYPTGIYRRDPFSNYTNTGHAVVIVSYNDDEQYWLCKNSWGSWADGGYFKIGYGECGIETWQNCTATVNQSCYAKITPNLIPSLNTAFSYGFVNNERASVIGNTTLTGNISIPSGKNLTLLSGGNINFSGYYIEPTGGTFNIQNGTTVYLKNGNKYYGLFTSISSALSAAVSSLTVEFIGSQSLSGAIVVPSGVTLKVNSGTTLNTNNGSVLTFANTAKFDIYGTLNAYNSTFDFTSPNPSIQNGIKFYPNSTSIFWYCTVRNAWYGIYHNNAYGSIGPLTIYNCYYGIYKYGGSAFTVSNNNIHNNTYGIALYNSDSEIFANDISYNSYHGVYCSSGSDAKFGVGSAHGNNHIYNNTYQGVYCYNNSYPNLGIDNPLIAGGWDGGWNNIYQNGSHDVHFAVDGILWAKKNWWGSNPAQPKLYAQNGTIVINPYLTSLPIEKISNENNGGWILSQTASSSTEGIINAEESLLVSLSAAMNLIAEKNYVNAREICLNIIESYPDSTASFNALNLLKYTFINSEKNSLKNVYQNIFSVKANKKLFAVAGLMSARLDEENKIQNIDEVTTVRFRIN